MFFLSSNKLQYSRTIVLLKKLKPLNHFFKSDDGHAIARQEKRWLPESTARFPAKKRWHSLPRSVGLSWDSPPLPAESVRTDGRTDGHVTIRHIQNFSDR